MSLATMFLRACDKQKEPLVKIEEVKQQPVERKWRISLSAFSGWAEVTEPEAREIHEYFAVVFGRWNLTSIHSQQLAEKEAEIARLKEQKKYNADEVVRLSNENMRLRALDTENSKAWELVGAQRAEIERLKKQTEQDAYTSRVRLEEVITLGEEVERLKGWLKKIRHRDTELFGSTTAASFAATALAGEKVPE